MPLPAEFPLVDVVGTLTKQDSAGTPCKGYVEFISRDLLVAATSNAVLVPTNFRANLDGSGQFAISVPSTNDPDITPGNRTLTVRIVTDGFKREYEAIVPWDADEPVDLTDLVIVAEPAPPVTYAPYHHFHFGPPRGPQQLVDAPTIVTDASTGVYFRVTLTADRILANPTNMIDGEPITYEIAQDNVGGRTLTLGDDFLFSDDINQLQLSTDPGKVDLFGVVYNATMGKFLVVGINRGFLAP